MYIILFTRPVLQRFTMDLHETTMLEQEESKSNICTESDKNKRYLSDYIACLCVLSPVSDLTKCLAVFPINPVRPVHVRLYINGESRLSRRKQRMLGFGVFSRPVIMINRSLPTDWWRLILNTTVGFLGCTCSKST